MRSVAGCLTCRRQKVKCDEKKPVCGRCSRTRKACEFPNIIFRHQQNSSSNDERNGLKKHYLRRRTFSSSDTWLNIPSEVTFVTENPSVTNSIHEKRSTAQITGPCETRDYERNGFDAILLPSSREPVSSPGQTTEPDPIYTPKESQFHDAFSPSIARLPYGIGSLLNPISTSPRSDSVGSHPPAQSSAFGASYAGFPQPQVFHECHIARPVETDPHVAFLLRYFSEKPGKWLDLYFLDAYFEIEVPIKALSHPLLKYAACAYAAKHLSRTRSKTDCPKTPVRQSHVASTTTWPNHENVDWAWHAAKYYGSAINLLRETLSHTHDISASPMQQPSPVTTYGDESSANYTGISDETLAAMAILCNFEFMSASDAEWTRHLSGTMLVLDLQHTGVVSLLSSRPSKAKKSIFWNYFRQDVFSAFILEGKTRLDIDNLEMWRTAGLELDEQGYVLLSNGSREGALRHDMISNAMIWILAKVFNHIASVKETFQQSTGSLDTGDVHWELNKRWETINHELDVWYEGLPDSFQPCARVERSLSEPATASSPPRPASIPDIWYTSAMCASTIQTYHLARMLLLVHRPKTNDMGFDLLNVYRSIEADLRFRSREIFGIALSSPVTSITLHQTQTIFVAAQCLVDEDERKMALDILRRVNTDLGWETEYRVQQLLRHWGWANP